MAINADDITKVVEAVKAFFKDLINPSMTIEKIAEVASPKLDEIIEKNKEKGLNYSAGKFKIKQQDDKHFTLEFEMYFKDEAGKWYKAANESEPREAELMEPSAWKTLKALKVVEFPIGAPNTEETAVSADQKQQNPDKTSETETSSQQEIPAASAKNEITLDKLMENKKADSEKE